MMSSNLLYMALALCKNVQHVFYVHCSSFSAWVKNIEALNVPPAERGELDCLIDKLYSDIDDGLCGFCIRNVQL